MSDSNNIQQKLTSWLSEQSDIQYALLFGSFADQTFHDQSDIDLAIALKKRLTANKKLELLKALLDLSDRTIDLIDLNTVGEPLLNEIIQKGILLKGSKQQLTELKIKNLNMMQDFMPYIQRTLKERRARLLGEV